MAKQHDDSNVPIKAKVKETKSKVEGEITLRITGEEKPTKIVLTRIQKNIITLYDNVSPIVTISTDNMGGLNIYFLFEDESEETASKLAYILHRMGQTSMCPAYARMLLSIGAESPPDKAVFIADVLIKLGRLTVDTSEQAVIEPNDCFRNGEMMRKGE